MIHLSEIFQIISLNSTLYILSHFKPHKKLIEPNIYGIRRNLYDKKYYFYSALWETPKHLFLYLLMV